jgi:hypothetical protein
VTTGCHLTDTLHARLAEQASGVSDKGG